MKLICCNKCGDIFNLTATIKFCGCLNSRGFYTNELDVMVSGDCFLLGISTSGLAKALALHTRASNERLGWTFEAFIIPENANTVRRVDG